MQLGAVFPSRELPPDPGAIRAFAVGVEELGFDHLVAYDHVLGAPHHGRARPLTGPYDEHHPFHEPFVLFGHLAAVTTRLELVVGVLVAPQRQAALVAKQAAEVQILSDGRLRLGLGTGWNHVEYEALGADFDRRGSVLDEQVEVLRRLWTEPLIDVDGAHHRIDRAGILPRPSQDIPLWFGGYGPAALRRSARTGDGHLFGHLRPDIVDSAASLAALVAREGRAPEGFGIEAITDVGDADPDRVADEATTWLDAGGTHLTARTTFTAGVPDPGWRTVDDHLRALAAWRAAVDGAGLA